tara:strand:- start:67 stop:795 length:729 start_codon:yes stop_codon:yes gene_type:complete
MDSINTIRNGYNSEDEPYTQRLIYFDFETTGLNVFHDNIIEYTFINETGLIDNNQTSLVKGEDYITSLVNPECPLSNKVVEITKITDNMLKNKQPIQKKCKKMYEFLNKNTNETNFLVAHNALGFDKFFLKRALRPIDQEKLYTNYKYIDTLLLAKKVLPNIPGGYSLNNLCHYYNIPSGNHRSTEDTLAVRKLYHCLINTLKNDYFNQEEYMLNYPNYEPDFDQEEYLLDNPNYVYRFLMC